MSRISKWSEIMRNITLIGQLGLSLVVPVLICLFACYFLTTRFHVGGWVYIPGFILGIGSSTMSACKVYQSVTRGKDGKKDDRGPSFNRHI
jgi:hypothetical protein